MRRIGQPRGQELQLHLIHETSLELTFQLGTIPQSAKLMKKAWISWFLNLVVGVLFVGFTLVFMNAFINTKRTIPIPSSSFHPFYLFFAIFIIAPIIMSIYGLYSPYFTIWTFDRLSQRLVKTTTNLWGKNTYIFPFHEIKTIEVEEHHDDRHTVTELYMVLKSGKQLTLSVSSYTINENEKADNLKYHQRIAEKMRHQAGL